MTTLLERVWYGDGALSWLVAPVLAPLSWLYAVGLAARAFAFRVGVLKSVRVKGLQVISVGNLVVGGSGKTPSVIALAKWGVASGRRVAVLTRGYGRTSTMPIDFDASSLPPVEQVGDEARLIARSCPGVRVFVGSDRVASAQRAKAQGFTVALLDDGFQHRRLHRDVDLLVMVKLERARLLPWGPLREPLSSVARATAMLNPDGARSHRLARLVDGSASIELSRLKGQRVVVLCGIARPSRFVESLEGQGASVVAVHAFRDHHPFTEAQREHVLATARTLQAVVVTTAKDAERLSSLDGVWVADVEATLDTARLAPLLSW